MSWECNKEVLITCKLSLFSNLELAQIRRSNKSEVDVRKGHFCTADKALSLIVGSYNAQKKEPMFSFYMHSICITFFMKMLKKYLKQRN